MAVKICKSCGESNSEHALLCVVCSTSLSDAPLEGTVNAEKRFTGILSGTRSNCWYCDEKLEPDVLTCKYCGSTVLKPARTGRSGAYYQDSGASGNGCATVLLFIATLLIPLVGLIVGGIFAFSDEPHKREVGVALLVFALAVIAIATIVGLFVV
ncbi:double zinc ribbon domain-containing protein [Paenibacillus thalictri]|uniref:DZANK-type domain-containing protein n=1 Tax=Paenibacillus thalictri TaxID=2527873 RepID=A0A4Q9DFX5_9BACL|nr:zinc ribbon domain-containing protein [Paenibacillus thalictri]TBL69825.1 hypothetical protein EYB31_35230 [Paenibacillus thalictri]